MNAASAVPLNVRHNRGALPEDARLRPSVVAAEEKKMQPGHGLWEYKVGFVETKQRN